MTFKQSKKTITATLIIIFVCIPLAAYLCYLAGDTNMYAASVVIVILAMLPFFISFEGSRPDARTMSTLAVMTAIVIVSRIAFVWLPSFKPMGGLIVITAVMFGAQAGFMTGALAMIISNIVFGQGPWTPWQMFCYGMIGFIGGLLAEKRIISEKHALRSAIVTFILVAVLSSAILDTCSVFFMNQIDNAVTTIGIYLAGIPYNIANATASALCVLVIIKPMTAIVGRLKVKYGL